MSHFILAELAQKKALFRLTELALRATFFFLVEQAVFLVSLAQEYCELIVLFEIMGHGAHKWCRMGSIWALDESPYEFHMGPKNGPRMGLDHLINSRALKKHRNLSGLAMAFENKQSFFLL